MNEYKRPTVNFLFAIFARLVSVEDFAIFYNVIIIIMVVVILVAVVVKVIIIAIIIMVIIVIIMLLLLLLLLTVLLLIIGNDVFSKHLFPMVSYTQNTHKIPIPSNPRSTLLPSPLPRPLQPV